MSRTVVGYEAGRAIYRDDGPARARPVGHGGAAMGQFSGTTLTVHQKRDLAPHKYRPRQHRVKVACGVPLTRLSGNCARAAGHADSHRTLEWMDRRAAGMRTTR